MRSDPLERFETFCMPEPMSGCVLWIGSLWADSGYGSFYYDGDLVRAHKWYWERLYGPVPVGLELDHLCRVRSCVNLRHLEIVTKVVNILRGNGATALNARKTHCLRGHEFTPENTYLRSARPGHREGNRECKTCWNARGHKVRSQIVAPRLPAPTSSTPPNAVTS